MPRTVLIIEKEPKQRQRCKLELEAEGYRVITAGDYHEALDYLHRKSVDLIVSELKMPTGRAVECLAEFLRMGHNPKLVITTDHPELSSDFKTWIADAFLTKSSDLVDLKQTIKHLLVEGEMRKRMN